MDGAASKRSRIRRGRRRFLLLNVGVALLGALAGAGLVALGIGFDLDVPAWGEPPGWATVLGAILVGAGAVTLVGGMLYLVGTGLYRRNARSPLWGENRARRRELVRQARGLLPVPDVDLPLVRRVAAQMDGQWTQWIPLSGVVLAQIGQVFIRWGPGWLALALLVTVASGLPAALIARHEGQARAFLRAHPEPPASKKEPTG
ncbi:hypothetical protein OG777_19805 [Micromonospora peucetia]|uniref:Uncharacterized protein n=1 Tax=Micromonospora peucetia TaxID=47871 RepID=A0A1C6V4C7_9ACTN|nr:hypothetical protein [Micromonospora peucetia]MCX4389156.1 hypothetical protein [Micromonospora peucetia]WSA35351.1 hypothetical protein OIE14_15555 [Micromonospora peucetia]SCL61201.1 hypothetical protein GA0070608_2433 [Micromonospora peucetia]